MNIIHCDNISFDFDKACYDLALIYAKSKLDEAVSDERLKYSTIPPKHIAEMELLVDTFFNALGYYSNLSKDEIKRLIDPE